MAKAGWEAAITTRLEQAFAKALREIAKFVEADILAAFDNEHGYDPSTGNKVSWPELSQAYIDMLPPRGRAGSAHPILNFKGDLRSSIKAKVEGFSLNTDVTSGKMKPRGKGDISVADISSILAWNRPHTFPSPKWQEDSPKIAEIIRKYFRIAVDELHREGFL